MAGRLRRRCHYAFAMVEESVESVSWPQVFARLVAGEDLARGEAKHLVAEMLAGEATEAQVGAFLLGLRAKGETTEELLGMRDAMFDVSKPLDLPAGTVDIVGVGGAPRRRVAAFNVSTIASLVASAAGARVCKHGNRKASSTSGSFDLLEALGVNIEASPEVVASGVAELGVGFAFARAHHPSMRHVGPARAQLGIPTVFNVLGPLAHPGRIKRQVLGVPDAARAEQIANVVASTDAELVWVVHGHDDIDELSLTGPANVVEIRDGEQRSFVVDPADFDIAVSDADAIQGGDAAVNKALTEQILAGEPSVNRDMVVLNAAAGLVVGGVSETLAEAMATAAEAIDSGKAKAKLDALVAHTNQ